MSVESGRIVFPPLLLQACAEPISSIADASTTITVDRVRRGARQRARLKALLWTAVAIEPASPPSSAARPRNRKATCLPPRRGTSGGGATYQARCEFGSSFPCGTNKSMCGTCQRIPPRHSIRAVPTSSHVRTPRRPDGRKNNRKLDTVYRDGERSKSRNEPYAECPVRYRSAFRSARVRRN